MLGNITISDQVALLVGSHIQLDAAIVTQLKEVVCETEKTAMQLMNESRKLNKATHLDNTMLTQPKSSKDLQAYCNMMLERNAQLVAGIAEIIGHIQYQDAVRQRIERIETAISKRNKVFVKFAKHLTDHEPSLFELALQMQDLLSEYRSLESRHASKRPSLGEKKVEFF